MGWCGNGAYMDVQPRLPNWLGWFMTRDNSLYGDSPFQQVFPRGAYWSKIRWLLRNPAPSLSLRTLVAPYNSTVYGDTTIRDNDNAKAGRCFVTCNGLFQLRWIKKIPRTNRCILVNLGWNIMELVDDNIQMKPSVYEATFVFSPRISGFR